ncbi:FHA domain-containing protein [Patescibacteria group bacterium]|nr:FHA domain-containing protein [Patescibacteria group bacterium]MBU1683522.1 FHA domain-containing protein [Patescibacteria group bacterium]MBU1935187.1 FHA domain-containing protein [Patescibacteria group bacterium]
MSLNSLKFDGAYEPISETFPVEITPDQKIHLLVDGSTDLGIVYFDEKISCWVHKHPQTGEEHPIKTDVVIGTGLEEGEQMVSSLQFGLNTRGEIDEIITNEKTGQQYLGWGINLESETDDWGHYVQIKPLINGSVEIHKMYRGKKLNGSIVNAEDEFPNAPELIDRDLYRKLGSIILRDDEMARFCVVKGTPELEGADKNGNVWLGVVYKNEEGKWIYQNPNTKEEVEIAQGDSIKIGRSEDDIGGDQIITIANGHVSRHHMVIYCDTARRLINEFQSDSPESREVKDRAKKGDEEPIIAIKDLASLNGTHICIKPQKYPFTKDARIQRNTGECSGLSEEDLPKLLDQIRELATGTLNGEDPESIN